LLAGRTPDQDRAKELSVSFALRPDVDDGEGIMKRTATRRRLATFFPLQNATVFCYSHKSDWPPAKATSAGIKVMLEAVAAAQPKLIPPRSFPSTSFLLYYFFLRALPLWTRHSLTANTRTSPQSRQ
jgi:hypothetical protein